MSRTGAGKKISVQEISDELIKTLAMYADITTEAADKAVDAAADEVISKIEQTAPRRTGEYAVSWRATVTNYTARGKYVVVHSPGHYQIAHLLEFGHAKRGGGRTREFPHIAAAEEAGEKKLLDEFTKLVDDTDY